MDDPRLGSLRWRFSDAEHAGGCSNSTYCIYIYIIYIYISDWWFGTFFISHNIWIYTGCHPSHWLSYFSRCLKPPTIYIYIHIYIYLYFLLLKARNWWSLIHILTYRIGNWWDNKGQVPLNSKFLHISGQSPWQIAVNLWQLFGC